MVKDSKQDSVPRAAKQGVGGAAPEPDKIKASTPYDFEGRNLTAYGGLLPVATMLEKLGFLNLAKGIKEAHLVSKYSSSGLVCPRSHDVAGRNVFGPSPWHWQRFQRGFATATDPNNVFTSMVPPALLV